MITNWINALNTTAFRIIVSVCVSAVCVVLLVFGILFRNYLPTSGQTYILEGVGLFLIGMMGLDVAQFASKRFSDATYAAAKNTSQPVAVDTPAPSEPAKDASDGKKPSPRRR